MALRIRHAQETTPELHDINITPFIDVMLVLLVIFMVAAPMDTVNVPVDLPSSTEKSTPPPEKPVFLTIKADHTLSLGDDPISREEMEKALSDVTHGNKETRLFLRADKTVTYEVLMDVMGKLRHAGYLKVSLVTEQQSEERAPS